MADDPSQHSSFPMILVSRSQYDCTSNLSDSDVFYYANGVPVTYYYFVLNLAIILVHTGIIWLNAAMIQAIRRSRKIREPTGHCLIILSLSYIWLAFNMMYIACYGLFNMQNLTECLIRFGLNHSAYYMVSWSNLLLTIDRMLHIEMPLHYESRVKIRYVWISTFIVTLVGLLYCESLLLFGWYNPSNIDTQVCKYFANIPALHLQIFTLFTFFTIPAVVTMYGRLVYIGLNQRRKMQQYSTYSGKRGITWRPIRVVTLITGVFLVGWGSPALFILYITFKSSYPPSEGYRTILSTLLLFPSISAVINPCFYTLHKEIKGLFKEACCCGIAFRKTRSRDASYGSKKSSTYRSDTIFHIQLEITKKMSMQEATHNSNISTKDLKSITVDMSDISDRIASKNSVDSGVSAGSQDSNGDPLHQTSKADISSNVENGAHSYIYTDIHINAESVDESSVDSPT